MRVVLDPGHGGDEDEGGSSWNNATGPTGLLEKTVTLDVALLTQLYLGGLGVDCRLTRSSDVNLGLQQRAAVARSWPADAFVSIHFNASIGHNAQGTETWRHTQANAPSRSLRTAVQAATVAATGLADREEKIGNFGVLRPDYHHASTGVCLVEISFMDRAEEEARLKLATYKDRIARGLAQGIYGWLVANGRAKLPGFESVKFTDYLDLPEPQDGFDMNGGARVIVPESCRDLGIHGAFGAEPATNELTLGQRVPNASEVATCGAMTAKIVRGTPAFNTLVQNDNADIVFKDEEGTRADRMMSPRMKTKLDALASLVKAEWNGVKLRVTEAWDEDGEHAGTSLHYEGRAADVTTSPVDGAKLGRLGRLAVDAGFDWVLYEDTTHVHVSVKKQA